ncbi:MAG: MATE family efflux transporter [Clostridia bacterium]|nr:MATE family efflux transporter [Clostridia bacterium]
MKSNDKTELFERMPVRRAVIGQIIPAIISQMIALIYNLADTYFVGLLDDPGQLAAITITASPFLFLTALSNLFGVGGASALSRALGRKKQDKATEISAISFWGGLLCALLYGLIMLIFAHPILRLCGAKEATFDAACGYVRGTILIGGAGTVLKTLLANLVRAEGAASKASFGVSFGGLLNLVLDPIFVLPQFLGLGAVGAGAATAISNFAAAVYFLIYILRSKTTLLSISPKHLRRAKEHLGTILSVGFPSALQLGLTVVGIAAQSHFVSAYSTEAIAGLGITKKLDQLPLYFSIGVANGLMPFLGYNFASGNQERRSQAFRFGAFISCGFSVLCLIVYETFAPFLVGIFIKDAVTLQYSSVFLRSMVTAMPMMALCYPLIIQFQAMGKVKEALVCSLLRKGVLDIPFLFLMDSLFPLYGCMWVQPIVDTISLIAALLLYSRVQKQMTNNT